MSESALVESPLPPIFRGISLRPEPYVETDPKQLIIMRYHDPEESLHFFERRRQDLYENKEYRGKYVLICGTQLIDVYERYEDALGDGHRRFVDTGFLVRKIEKPAEPIALNLELR